MGYQNLREFIQALSRENEIVTITTEVDPHLELAEIHRRVVGQRGKALLFTNVKGSSFPVATNLFGSEKRINLAFPNDPEKTIQSLVTLLTQKFPPSLQTLWHSRHHLSKLLKLGTKTTYRSPVTHSSSTDLDSLPILKCWPDDGGNFITLPLVYTESPTHSGSPNLGMYRIQRFSKSHTGLHFQIGKGGGFHYKQAEEENRELPVTISIGGPPALILSAIAPLPENVPELVFASLLAGKKIKTTRVKDHPHPLFSEAEFVLIGHANPRERQLEGPFGDHFGYYGLAHDFPVFHCKKIYHRSDAIYPATVVGKPIQEDLYIGNYLQELFTPLIKTVMPNVKSIWSYAETGFHPLASAIVKERYEKEALSAAFKILGEGQLSLTKFLLITDQPVDLRDIKTVLETILERCRPESDFYIFSHTANDTLDYTGPRLNMGSKAVLIGTGNSKRSLPATFQGTLPTPFTTATAFCKGCLVISGPNYEAFPVLDSLLQHTNFANWPLVIVVDDAIATCKSSLEFLWTVFTRFEPAGDIIAKERIDRHHISYQMPLIIDARMKPRYPKEALVDQETEELVTSKWSRYGIPL